MRNILKLVEVIIGFWFLKLNIHPPPSSYIFSCKLQRVVYPDFFLPANCSTKFQAVFVKLQIAALNL